MEAESELRRLLAEAQARGAEMEKAKEAAEAREKAEKQARENAEARERAEKQARETAEAREMAEKQARETAEAREMAEKQAREIAEATATAEKQARETAEAREMAEKQAREAAEAATAAAQLREEQERTRRVDETTVNVRQFLTSVLPDYDHEQGMPPASSTKLKRDWQAPFLVEEWTEFHAEKEAFLSRVNPDSRVRRKDEVPHGHKISLSHETSVHTFSETVVLSIASNVGLAVGDLAELDLCRIGKIKGMTRGGICDIYLHLQEHGLVVIELKRPRVVFQCESFTRPVDMYHNRARIRETGANNVTFTIIQTYNYMLSKGLLHFGVFTNYDHWGFLKRRINEQGKDILMVSRLYPREEARLPLAYCMAAAYEDRLNPRVSGARHPSDPQVIRVIESQTTTGASQGTVGTVVINGHERTGEFIDSDQEEEEEMDRLDEEATDGEFFVPGKEVEGVRFTTTSAQLGVESLSVDATEVSTMIVSSEKATTFRIQIGGRDLVYRQMDVYKLPRVNEDYSMDVLQKMVRTELRAYKRLEPHWGLLVPHLVYFGRDFSMLWVMVTTYEGVSLSKLAEEHHGLTAEVKTAARKSLAKLHSLGVAHGDVSLRNAVYRQSDRSVLWVDFEFAQVDNVDPAVMQQERAELARLLDEVATAKKRRRTEVVASCCC